MPEKNIISFTRGVPAPETFPAEKLAVCAQEVLSQESGQILQYGQAAGYKPLREIIAAQSGVALERVMLGQGSLQLFDHVVRMLVKPGDAVLVELPTYDRILTLLRRAGANVIGIDLEEDGISFIHLEKILHSGIHPVLFYLIPDFQNPTGSVMAAVKRRRLMELADQYGFLVVEDAPYRALRYSGSDLPSLFEINPHNVLQLSSFSKLISPGLRVGYAVLPQEIASRVIQFAEDTYINPSYFNQAMAHRFIQKGWLQSHLLELKQLYAKRLDSLMIALDAAMTGKGTWTHPSGGFFVGFFTKQSVDSDHLMKAAEKVGLRLSDGRGFFVQGGQNFIRLPFCALTPAEIESGVRRLAELF
jgi:2-aminoadipate transaminase